MGMYTAISTSITLKDDAPKGVVEVLRVMVDGDREKFDSMEKPDHEFFLCSRACCLFTMDSAYFDFDTASLFDGKNLLTISNLKNYSDEISKFFGWVWKYCDVSLNPIIGASVYEEDYDYEEKASTVYSVLNGELVKTKAEVDYSYVTNLIVSKKKEIECHT